MENADRKKTRPESAIITKGVNYLNMAEINTCTTS